MVAFWHYDLYPFVLSGHVKNRNDKGHVEIAEYGNSYWVQPMFELPDEQGEKLKAELEGLKADRSAEESVMRSKFNKKLEKLVLSYGFANTEKKDYYPKFAPRFAQGVRECQGGERHECNNRTH